MRIVKYMFLEILLLCAMLLCSTAVLKVLDVLFNLDYKNIFAIGFKVGFIAWLLLLAITLIVLFKKKHEQN